MNLKAYIDGRPRQKRFLHWLLIPKYQARPRRWVSWFLNPLVHYRHASSHVRHQARLDAVPFNTFRLGAKSIIEDFSVVNNGVGGVTIGTDCLLGIGSVVIGPVQIGNKVIIAQHVVLSGMNHEYKSVLSPIQDQSVTTNEIVIEDDCWIGANVRVIAGVNIGRHSVIAGGSVVTHDVPAFTMVGGNPARVLKRYDIESSEWLTESYPTAERTRS